MVFIYHGEEDAELWIQVDYVSVGEDELLFPLLPAAEDDGDLLSSHGEHRQLDPVKLVETSPRAGLSQTYTASG